MTLGGVQGISDCRTLALEHESIVDTSSGDSAKDGDEERDDEVEALGREDLAAVDNGREKTRTKVASRVDGL